MLGFSTGRTSIGQCRAKVSVESWTICPCIAEVATKNCRTVPRAPPREQFYTLPTLNDCSSTLPLDTSLVEWDFFFFNEKKKEHRMRIRTYDLAISGPGRYHYSIEHEECFNEKNQSAAKIARTTKLPGASCNSHYRNCLDDTREFLEEKYHVYPGTKLRRVVPGLSVPRINLGKKLTGYNPALLPRCFLCRDLPGNSSGFKNPCVPWYEVAPGCARIVSSQDKPRQEAHQVEPGAFAQVFPVPGFTREFLGMQKPMCTLGRSCAGLCPDCQFPG